MTIDLSWMIILTNINKLAEKLQSYKKRQKIFWLLRANVIYRSKHLQIPWVTNSEVFQPIFLILSFKQKYFVTSIFKTLPKLCN